MKRIYKIIVSILLILVIFTNTAVLVLAEAGGSHNPGRDNLKSWVGTLLVELGICCDGVPFFKSIDAMGRTLLTDKEYDNIQKAIHEYDYTEEEILNQTIDTNLYMQEFIKEGYLSYDQDRKQLQVSEEFMQAFKKYCDENLQAQYDVVYPIPYDSIDPDYYWGNSNTRKLIADFVKEAEENNQFVLFFAKNYKYINLMTLDKDRYTIVVNGLPASNNTYSLDYFLEQYKDLKKSIIDKSVTGDWINAYFYDFIDNTHYLNGDAVKEYDVEKNVNELVFTDSTVRFSNGLRPFYINWNTPKGIIGDANKGFYVFLNVSAYNDFMFGTASCYRTTPSWESGDLTIDLNNDFDYEKLNKLIRDNIKAEDFTNPNELEKCLENTVSNYLEEIGMNTGKIADNTAEMNKYLKDIDLNKMPEIISEFSDLRADLNELNQTVNNIDYTLDKYLIRIDNKLAEMLLYIKEPLQPQIIPPGIPEDPGDSLISQIIDLIDELISLNTDKFPFCIPYDFLLIFQLFAHAPETPHFEFPIEIASLGINEKIVIDLEGFIALSFISRAMFSLLFIMALIKITREYIKFLKDFWGV